MHLRFAKLDQCYFQKHSFLCCVFELICQLGKNTDIPEQHPGFDHLCFLFQLRQILRRYIQHILHIIRSLHQKKIAQIPGKICCKLCQFSSLHHKLFHRSEDLSHILTDDLSEKSAEHIGIHSAKNLKNMIIGQLLPEVKRNALIQKT